MAETVKMLQSRVVEGLSYFLYLDSITTIVLTIILMQFCGSLLVQSKEGVVFLRIEQQRGGIKLYKAITMASFMLIYLSDYRRSKWSPKMDLGEGLLKYVNKGWKFHSIQMSVATMLLVIGRA